ncbi:TilS substrate-binding domain-containing protein [Halopseudomonas pachastrellae]|nr:TilS substrate-binding domain-containing protein [Halopseudomonas pachastrellae]
MAEPSADPWLAGWPSLLLAPLLSLSAARQRNLLRCWLRQQAVRMPDHRQLLEVQQQLAAGPDAQPQLKLDGFVLYRSSDRLWLVPAHWLPARSEQSLLPLHGALALAAMARWTAGRGQVVCATRALVAGRCVIVRAASRSSWPGVRPSR